MVSALTFYSDDPSLNPAEAHSFLYNLCLKGTKINKKAMKKAGLRTHLPGLIKWVCVMVVCYVSYC